MGDNTSRRQQWPQWALCDPRFLRGSFVCNFTLVGPQTAAIFNRKFETPLSKTTIHHSYCKEVNVMNLAALTFADEVLTATETSKCNVRQGEYRGAVGRARKLLQNRHFFPIAQEPHLGLGHITVEVGRSHTVRHTTRGRTPLDEGSTRRRATHKIHDRHPCRQWVSNPQSQQEGGRATTATSFIH